MGRAKVPKGEMAYRGDFTWINMNIKVLKKNKSLYIM